MRQEPIRHDESMVRGYAVTHPPGEVRLPVQPGWDQVIYAKSGAFRAGTDRRRWTVPPHRAICIGDGSSVRIETTRPAAIRCLYLRTELDTIPGPIRVITLEPLTRHLLLHAVESSPLDLRTPVEVALVTLLADRLADQPGTDLHLPLPADERARALAESTIDRPERTLEELIAPISASRRTLERFFKTQTGLTLGAWQRRARVLAAIEHMAAGRSVTEAATAVGYATPSSFVAAFQSELAQTPRAFMTTTDRPPS